MRFDEYLHAVQQCNYHPKLSKLKMPVLENLIFYGPAGVGKYSQMLHFIKQYSPSQLKYEKKMSITYDKKSYLFKMSDIHVEVDMSLLGCISKLLWHELYQHISELKNPRIIVCKEFHLIHQELLDMFYSYMQDNHSPDESVNKIKFIFLTEELSFIPNSILNCCNLIRVPRVSCKNTDIQLPHKIICDKLIHAINQPNFDFLKFRDKLYDIFVYNLNVSDCIWYIFTTVSKQVSQDKQRQLLLKTDTFFRQYNNNYRPIYHIENYLVYLSAVINGFDSGV